ncbi:MAG: hypothetical protein ACKVQJ_09610 [Pyrinomonadaceae bacterium]
MNSAKSSQSSVTDASRKQSAGSSQPANAKSVIAACMAAAAELENTRVLVTAIENESQLLKDRLETELRTTALLRELNESRRSEGEALRTTVNGKNETIAAKDNVIAAQEKLIDALKQKRPSPWRRLGDILIGAALITLVK